MLRQSHDARISRLLVERRLEGGAMTKGTTGAAAGGGALYGLGIFGALFYYWQQASRLGPDASRCA